ncbi:hypothetical protein LXL04_025844 [Taraxacum kok-saghyz]
MARTMRMLEVVEDPEYLEHPNKELVAQHFKGGGTGINEVLKELKCSDARTALFAATAFEPLLRMGDVKGEGVICHTICKWVNHVVLVEFSGKLSNSFHHLCM